MHTSIVSKKIIVEGNYWFTSLHNGIFLVPNLETEVKLLLPVAHKPYAFTYFN